MLFRDIPRAHFSDIFPKVLTSQHLTSYLVSLSFAVFARLSPSQTILQQKALEARIAALEKGEVFASTQKAIQQVQANCLQQLRDVRQALDEQGGGAACSTPAAVAEKQALEKRVAKLEYRVQHLVSSCEYLYEKAKTAPSN